MARSADLTSQLLEKILHEIRDSHLHLGELRQEVREFRLHTNQRLDLLCADATRTNTDLAGITQSLAEVRERLEGVAKDLQPTPR